MVVVRILRILGLVAVGVMRHPRFGKFTRASNGKWFTKDKAGHGGSVSWGFWRTLTSVCTTWHLNLLPVLSLRPHNVAPNRSARVLDTRM
jgi:hypothetical protein